MEKRILKQIEKDVPNMYSDSKKIHCIPIPLVNIPLMSDERFQQIAAEQKRQRETAINGGTEALK